MGVPGQGQSLVVANGQCSIDERVIAVGGIRIHCDINDFPTVEAIAAITCITTTGEGTRRRVGAGGVFIAIVGAIGALVDVRTARLTCT